MVLWFVFVLGLLQGVSLRYIMGLRLAVRVKDNLLNMMKESNNFHIKASYAKAQGNMELYEHYILRAFDTLFGDKK